MVRIQNMRPLAFKLLPWEFFEKFIILSKMDENNFFEKCVLELCRTAMIKPRRIKRSGFFSTEPQQTNSSLQTGLRSIGCLVVEKSQYSDTGWTRVKLLSPHGKALLSFLTIRIEINQKITITITLSYWNWPCCDTIYVSLTYLRLLLTPTGHILSQL